MKQGFDELVFLFPPWCTAKNNHIITTVHDIIILLTRPAQSMITRQQKHYMTYCRQDPHEAWLKTATTIHDVLSTRPT